ncbi:MAG: hypothetical protein ACKVQA_25805 [Burkholderiales bacterium]
MANPHSLIALVLLALSFSVQAAVSGADTGEDKKKAIRGNAFGSKNWRPAPAPRKAVKAPPVIAAPVVLPPSPPPPSAPPLPFVYLGKMVDGASTTVFLSSQQRNLAVQAGDTIDNLYRVDRIADNNMTLIYLPLNAQQQLHLGGSK